jgi:hypothetical protein
MVDPAISSIAEIGRFTMTERVIHFGTNPINGGRPLKDSKKILRAQGAKIDFAVGLKEYKFMLEKTRKIGKIKQEYIIKYKRVIVFMEMEIRAVSHPR